MASNKAIIRNGKIIYGVNAEIPKPNETEAKANRNDQKVRHRADMLQPTETDYYRVYKDQAKDLPDETRRLLS